MDDKLKKSLIESFISTLETAIESEKKLHISKQDMINELSLSKDNYLKILNK